MKGDTLTLISQDSFTEEIPYYSPKRPWYQASLAQPKQQVWTVYLYRTGNVPGLDSTIVLQQKNQILGVIGIGFELKKISLQLQNQFQNREGDIFIANSKGEFIASNHPDEPIPTQVKGQDRAQLKQLNEATDPEIKRAVYALKARNISFNHLQQGQQFLEKDPETGKQYYISLMPSQHLDWVVGTVIPQSIYFDAIRRNEIRLFLIVSGFVLSIAIASIIVIDRMIAQPIEQIVEAIADVESGKIEGINLQEVSQQSNELGQLAQAFQMMAYQVYAREQALKKAEVELQVLNQDLEARIQKRTGELESSLAEKNTLLQEVHHRVKNNLQMIASMLKLQAASVQDPKILDTLKVSQSRVRVMALIHEKLYQSSDLSRINFAHYIEQLLKDLTLFYSTAEKKPNLQLQVDSLELGVELAIPCGLIINELVSNALKHAFPGDRPGVISIIFRLTASQEYSLNVADNGVGLPDNFDIQTSHSLGLQLVQALTRQLEGQLEFHRDHGSSIQILFPAGGEILRQHPTSVN
jgi:two-component sensor histidine kinase